MFPGEKCYFLVSPAVMQLHAKMKPARSAHSQRAPRTLSSEPVLHKTLVVINIFKLNALTYTHPPTTTGIPFQKTHQCQNVKQYLNITTIVKDGLIIFNHNDPDPSCECYRSTSVGPGWLTHHPAHPAHCNHLATNSKLVTR